MSFWEFGLSEAVVHGVQALGFQEPTPIQTQSFSVVLAGGDLIASAQTGTGKTAAFAMPLISKLAHHAHTRCLVLEPTRELALQVEEAFRDYSKFTDLKVAAIFGGVGYGPQLEALRSGVDVIVATPGRLLDLMERGDADLGTIEYLVLDEVDRMLDMGFLPDVRRVVTKCRAQRQTLLFSATMPAEIQNLASWAQKDPQRLEIGSSSLPAETVTHAFYPVAASQKFELLLAILERVEYHSVIVFTRTRGEADRIARQMETAGHSVVALHSDRTQRERTDALDGFRSGKYEVLVATDLAARGLDVASVSHVINYDIPTHPEDYVHRIGRTGRAAATGDAFTLITTEDLIHVRAIEAKIEQKVARTKLDGFSYTFSTIFDETRANAAAQAARRFKAPIRRR
ncbi:MAG: DEAD/DEAH box helicase [Chthoniobacterales bacterium]